MSHGPFGQLMIMGVGGEPLALETGTFVGKRMRVIGSTQNGREYLYEALDYAAKGKVKVIAETYKLDEAAKAYARVAEGTVRFRAVLAI